VLRHHLNQLYGIDLPETVDLCKTPVADIHADILAQIRRSEPAVELRLVEKATLRLIKQKALQRMQQYRRRRPGAAARMHSKGWLPPFSYARDDYRPLGRALFEHWVRPSELPQRFEAGAAPDGGPRRPQMTAETVEREGYVLEESSGHRYAWDLDLTQVTLANFNYKKMSLVRDYSQLLDDSPANPAFDRVFSIEPRDVETAAPPPLPLHDQWNVVAGDATQNAAVVLARNARSFIIQGPPGTGKSQTITNLIADYAARGKRVLFVCEKRAALDVVFHRLKQSGLAPLCSLIHDSQADKKAFIADLKACYEQWIAAPHDSEALAAKRKTLIGEMMSWRARIDAFESAMAAAPASLNHSVRNLLRRIAALPAPPSAGPALRERLPDLAPWDKQGELVLRLHRVMRERFGVDSLAAHPFARLAPSLIADERAFGRVEQLCSETDALFDMLAPLLDNTASLINHDTALQREACAIASDAQWLLDTGLAAHLDLLEAGSTAQTALREAATALEQRRETLGTAVAANANWRDKLTAGDTEAALDLVRRLEPSPLRWLQPAWWRLRGELKRRYAFEKHAVHPGYLRVLEALAAEHAASAALAAMDNENRKRYGVPDMQAFMRAANDLQAKLRAGTGPRTLIAHLRHAVDAMTAARAQAGARETLEKLAARVREGLALEPDARLGEIAELLRDVREALEDLPDLLPLLRAAYCGDTACAEALRRLALSPPQFDALIADEALRRLERNHPALTQFGGAGLARAARELARGQHDLLAQNAQAVLASQHRQFSEHVRLSALSVTQLDADGKQFKKQYATGRRELEHEFGKSMRHRSIRDLAGEETGMVVNDLKPIWLMSPLSVSDTLPLTQDLFDVVIFDEASQIPTEEAVPALSRAAQIVVVGDEMQLPPTSFFTASGTGDEDEIMVEEEGERIAINLDSDSLLNQAARNLPATLLAWHYRSRHESLISFSNAAFYDGRLVTIPDQALHGTVAETPSLRSDMIDAGIAGADALMARPISFHRIGDGVYIERCNVPEARTIARMVREMLRRETGLSLGIVAFSEAQQNTIESELEALAAEDSDFATRLEREYVREDDDQFNGLFVKNLENVQGDERDVIILSICYAPGPDGKMQMNFGPINQRGGEKRLNVIFSRARHRMAVVSTIEAEAITNLHNDGAAALRTFLRFAQASAAGRFDEARSVLGGLNQGARQAFIRQAPPDSIRDAIARALRGRGHEVHANVGSSQFRCDLAIVERERPSYALAILLDNPEEAVEDTLERYVFRPGILRSFGWKVLDLPGKDWLDDSDAVLERIEKMLADGEDRALDVAPASEFDPPPVLTPPVGAPPEALAEKAPVRSDDAKETVRSLHFEQGGSQKFWRASVRGNELTVTFGRKGSNGQSLLKQFESNDRALKEMEKLVTEKTRKGYLAE
jgi:predicted DNA-binding WGR domain protein